MTNNVMMGLSETRFETVPLQRGKWKLISTTTREQIKILNDVCLINKFILLGNIILQ